jgi:hypothetical protein
MVQSLIPGHMGNGGQMSCGHNVFVYSIENTYKLQHLSVYLCNISKICSSCIRPLYTIPLPIKDIKSFAVSITLFAVFHNNKGQIPNVCHGSIEGE